MDILSFQKKHRGVTNKMKKILAMILACMMVCSLAFACAETAEETRWTDEENGLSFALPDGWRELTEDELDTSAGLKWQIVNLSSQDTSIAYGVLDLYAALGESGDRADYDFAWLEENESIRSQLMYGVDVQSEEIKEIAGLKFYCLTTEMSSSGLTFKMAMTFSLVNGYVIMFDYMSLTQYDTYYPVFEEYLESIEVAE